MITLSFNCPVKAVQSVRATKSGHFFQPQDVVKYKKFIAASARDQVGSLKPFSAGGVVLDILYVFRALKGFPKWKMDILRNGGKIYKLTKPDITDNTQKGWVDALQGILFDQDQRICKVAGIEKIYGLEDKMIIKAWEVEEIQEENLFNYKQKVRF